MNTLPDSFFKELTEDEAEQFKQWARDNYVPGKEISEVWHPIVRRECERMNSELLLMDEGDYEWIQTIGYSYQEDDILSVGRAQRIIRTLDKLNKRIAEMDAAWAEGIRYEQWVAETEL